MWEALRVGQRWEGKGLKVVAATLVAVGGSTPRRSGARLLMSSAGDTWGSVSFGCVESDVAAHARAVFETGLPRLAAYGMTDDDAFAVGFTCGGTMEVFIEPWTGIAHRLGRMPDEAFVGAFATVVAGPGIGTHALIDRATRSATGDLPSALADTLVGGTAAVTDTERAQVIRHGESAILMEPIVPSPRLLVFGAGHTTQALTTAATAVGFRVTVCDHRPALARAESYPEAAEVLCGWPEELMPRLALDSQTYAVVLAHNPDVEDQCLPPLLAGQIRYLGVLGSRRTHAARVARLTAAGVPAAHLGRMHAPVGLDIGAVTPEEIAASIVAELITERRKPQPGGGQSGQPAGGTAARETVVPGG